MQIHIWSVRHDAIVMYSYIDADTFCINLGLNTQNIINKHEYFIGIIPDYFTIYFYLFYHHIQTHAKIVWITENLGH